MPEKQKPPPDETPIYTSDPSSRDSGARTPPDLRLLHYNDVYHVDASSAEPVGGVARFVTLARHYRDHDRFKDQPRLLTFFSGDAFNPSLESSVTKGDHMVPLLNKIGTDAAALGNHDLDFGVNKFENLASKCKFPWLVANVLDPALGEGVPIGHCRGTHMITASNGLRVGLVGLGEREWLATINSLPPGIEYRSATATARELVPKLRAQGADIVIALTHMREPNDNKLAEQTEGLFDLILGGHDHYYAHNIIHGTHVLRSGSDFKQLSYLEARRRPDDGSGRSRWDFDVVRRDATSAVAPHAGTTRLVDRLTASLKAALGKPIGYAAAPLDARFRTVRLRESNLANWVCDIMRHYYRGDCALMASGTVRGDQVYAPGPILLKDIMNCFPFEDPVVVIRVTGTALRAALENGLSLYPALEGRFPQVSNIVFSFDATREPGSRIVDVSVGGQPLDPEARYTLVTRGYMARGKDGYDSLLVDTEGGSAEEVVSEENGILISMLLRQYFMSLRAIGQWCHWGNSMRNHWDGVAGRVAEKHTLHRPAGGTITKTPLASPEIMSQKPPSSAFADTGPGDAAKDGGWEPWSPHRIRERRACMLPLADDDEEEPEDDDDDDDDGDDGAKTKGNGAPEMVVNSSAKAAAAASSVTKTVLPGEIDALDREMQTMRRVFRKWARLAGVQLARAADPNGELGEGEFQVDWTRAIAPRIEGRIVCLGGGV